jgi:hypothetical protein
MTTRNATDNMVFMLQFIFTQEDIEHARRIAEHAQAFLDGGSGRSKQRA